MKGNYSLVKGKVVNIVESADILRGIYMYTPGNMKREREREREIKVGMIAELKMEGREKMVKQNWHISCSRCIMGC